MTLQIYKIATVTVTTSNGAATIDFTSIPNGYTDLQLVCSLRTNGSGVDSNPWNVAAFALNGTVVPNFPAYARQLYGTGSAVGSDYNSNPIISTDTNNTANTFSSVSVYIPNYTRTTDKSISVDNVTENNATASIITLNAALIPVTSAVTSITLTSYSQNFAQNSTATLYGIL